MKQILHRISPSIRPTPLDRLQETRIWARGGQAGMIGAFGLVARIIPDKEWSSPRRIMSGMTYRAVFRQAFGSPAHSPCSCQCRPAYGPEARLPKANIARRRVVHVNAEVLQLAEDPPRHRPVGAKLLLILPGPFLPYLVRKLRRGVQVSGGEIQHERRHHNGYFQRQQFIIEIQQVRDIKSKNLRHPQFFQPLIHPPLPEVRLRRIVNLQRRRADFRVAFNRENNSGTSTYPKASPLGPGGSSLRRAGKNGEYTGAAAATPAHNGAALSEARKFRRQIGASQSGLRFNGAPKRGVHCMNVKNRVILGWMSSLSRSELQKNQVDGMRASVHSRENAPLISRRCPYGRREHTCDSFRIPTHY